MQEIKETLKKVIKNLYNLDFEPEITPSPENIDADYSTNAPLKLAKELHKSPIEIANEIEQEIEKNTFEGRAQQREALEATEPRNDGSEGASRKSIITDAERNLIKKIINYKEVLTDAVAEMAPHKVANYLYELAQEFSRFYENCPVVGSVEESERLKLVKVYLDTMTHGLNILGIEIPEEM